jgi:hypothetical protein
MRGDHSNQNLGEGTPDKQIHSGNDGTVRRPTRPQPSPKRLTIGDKIDNAREF